MSPKNSSLTCALCRVGVVYLFSFHFLVLPCSYYLIIQLKAISYTKVGRRT
ncbi:MAG TPA: hypothetical protein EYH01_05315 [Campylobacterales bacterium]|nr:hypothetical protein [Campylobacterales bacterium]HIP59830.1 hypothetical protein [Campylobacterales bacterium]